MQKTKQKISIDLIASLAPARAEIEAGVVAKADQQLEAEQYPCGECDYVAKLLNNLKRHKLTYLLGDIKMYFTPQIAYDESGRVSM